MPEQQPGSAAAEALSSASFWEAVRRRSRDALRDGALQTISTRASYIEERGVEFVVRVSDNLLRKRHARGGYGRPHGENPFLPPDTELTVGSLPPRHLAVLNKFNVLDDHVLVITRDFVHQEAPLDAADFSAAAVGLGDGRRLAFYNAGRTAGASQPHRHFQLVPLPLGRSEDIPTAVLLADAADGIDTAAGLPLRHAFFRLSADPGDSDAFGRECVLAYREALAGLGLSAATDRPEGTRLPPYNLLLTRDWMLLVPRARERCARISVNSLGYAGSLFVSTQDKLDRVRAIGPMTLLEKVSIPVT